MEDMDLTDGDLLSDKIEINLHMLGVLMLNKVGGEVHDANIVIVDKCASRWRTLELMEQLAQPGGLSYAISDSVVLSLGVGLEDDHLSLDRPGHQVVPQEHRIVRHRATSVRTTSPVSIGVDDSIGAS
jgi:hypothetical protein